MSVHIASFAYGDLRLDKDQSMYIVILFEGLLLSTTWYVYGMVWLVWYSIDDRIHYYP